MRSPGESVAGESIVRSLGESVAGDKKLFHFTGNSSSLQAGQDWVLDLSISGYFGQRLAI